ncbi:MAG: fatty acid desaturase [Bacteroidota bacterium]
MLKNKADLRSVLFMVLAATTLVVLWNYGSTMSLLLFIPLYVLQLQMAVTTSVMVHNHQHRGIWKSHWMNIFTDNFLTVFYGFPVFAWIPTHNTNHHVHVNKEEDYTKTYMKSEKNNLGTLLAYPYINGVTQQKAVIGYYWNLRKENPTKFALHTLQLVSLVAWIAIALIIDWKKALMYVVIPQQLSLFAVLIFNYIQHVHADEETVYNSSRNITGWGMNFWLLNNGFHTVHHLSPHVHWSELPARHRKIEHLIHPSLNEPTLFGYIFRNYFLGMFSEKYRTKSMRLARLANQPYITGESQMNEEKRKAEAAIAAS